MTEWRKRTLRPGWWTLILIAVCGAFVYTTMSLFLGTFSSYVPVTLTSDRAGLVMESGGKVKMRGVEVGHVEAVKGQAGQASLRLQIDPDQVRYIPANVQARIRATTAFGAKYVDLMYPQHPTAKRLSAGEVIRAQNVSTEVNTVFQNLTDLLAKIDPAKLNAVLSALAEGLRGQGPAIGQAITDGNQVLMALNPRSETVRADWRSLKGFSDAYSVAAQDILKVLDAASITSTTITKDAPSLDQFLTGVLGLSNAGVELVAPNKANLIGAINDLEPTTRLLMKYNPELTCLLVGGKNVIDYGFGRDAGGLNGYSAVVDAALLLGDDPYKYPENLPVVNAKGGPGGKPGCGSLPDVAKNWPMRYLVTDTGWGTGVDMRPNPGIGFPGYVNYLPETRATPEAPLLRYPGGPAPGPIPYPGAPPFGAPMYAPDGTPLYPGLPPAPPPGALQDPGQALGRQPFVVPNPMQLQPTPTPPLPQEAVPSP